MSRTDKRFPLWAGTKRPAVQWSSVATDNAEILRRWDAQYPGCNWGLACGPSGVTVVDIDSPEALRWWMERGANTPVGRVVRTPRGGFHYYFLAGEISPTTTDFAGVEKLDLRGRGGYVVLPPGHTADGVYTLLRDDPLTPVPDWLADMFQACAAGGRKPDAQVPLVPYDDPANISLAENYLTFAAEPAVQGCAGDSVTYQTACRVRDFGISEAQCLALMAEFYNPRCSPPWAITGLDSLQRKVASAYAYAKDRPGNAATPNVDLGLFEPTSPVAGPIVSPAPQPSPTIYVSADEDPDFGSFDEEVLREDDPMNWVVRGWVPLGWQFPSLMCGTPGVGKSMSANQLLMCAASGIPFLGQAIETRPDYSIMVTCEDCPSTLRGRMRAFRAANRIESIPRYRVWYRQVRQNAIAQTGRSGLVPGPFFGELNARLKEFNGKKLVVLDCFRNVFMGSEIAANEVYTFWYNYMLPLAQGNDTTFIIPHHPAKSELSTFAGSVAVQGAVRFHTHIDLHDPENPAGPRRWKVVKANAGKVGDSILFTWLNNVMVLVDPARMEESADTVVYNELLRLQSQEGVRLSRRGPMEGRAVAHAFYLGERRLSASEITQAITRLVESGRLSDIKGSKHENGLHVVSPYNIDRSASAEQTGGDR